MSQFITVPPFPPPSNKCSITIKVHIVSSKGVVVWKAWEENYFILPLCKLPTCQWVSSDLYQLKRWGWDSSKWKRWDPDPGHAISVGLPLLCPPLLPLTLTPSIHSLPARSLPSLHTYLCLTWSHRHDGNRQQSCYAAATQNGCWGMSTNTPLAAILHQWNSLLLS